MLRQIFLLLAVIGVAVAVQCYVGQQTLSNRNNGFSQGVQGNTFGMSVRDCGPNVRMCFKSYVRRNNNGDDSHTETRDCGDPNSGRCFQDTGCSGPGSNKASASALKQELEDARAQLEIANQKTTNNEQLEHQITHLRNINQQWVAEVEKYKQWAQQWQSFQVSQMPNGGIDAGLQQLQAQITELEQQLGYGWQAYEAQSQQIQQQIASTQGWKQRAEELEQAYNQLRAEMEQLKTNFANGPHNPAVNGHTTDAKTEDELRRIKDEQEDLLVLLADQHNKLSSYRKRLKALGQVVSEDEDEE
ncbi:unnamed protein product, partial [Mesorhabditis belari]|uniref:Uso1/p115-like vesicle tethering protein C-terminal domain-containing protein n=1 Tax=Mesorhabditis belari TaxID=2138241 RepID=A0AAF3FNF3_9BILA